MNFLDIIGGKILDCGLAALGSQLGYLIHYKSNVDNLKAQVEKLRGARDRVQGDVDNAKNNVETIYDDVQKWLIDSDGVMIKADEIFEDNGEANMKCCNGWCPNLKSRYQVSKRSHKKGLEVKEIKDKAGKFDRVGHRESTPVGWTAKYNKGYEAFESRSLILTDVLEALKNPNITRIGLYGMGGIGKTMLAKEVLNQAERDKLFNKYLFVVVSNPPDLKKIQREIAGKLGLKLDVESTESDPADLLYKRLLDEKILLVMDDIWKPIDLESLGISFGDDKNGCKLLLTSRFHNVVCNGMGTQKQVKVGVLSDDEARNLFAGIVGEFAKTPKIQPYMLQIVKECAGLPIAITTVANALKNQTNIYVWKDFLVQLKKSSPKQIEGMDENVYKSVRLSYEFLGSEEEKSLLLLCSLHGEDYNIEVEDLLKYGVGLGLFRDVDTIEDARCRVHTLVEKLKNSSLLLDGDDNGTVKMHDVIRDVAINIAAEERHMFTIRTVNELQTRSKRKDAVAISLPYINGDLDVPNQFECSKLELLLLFDQEIYFRIPDSFFEGLKDLKVLKLSESWGGVFPSSLSSLENLQTLCLDGYEVQNAIIIGELKNLKALSLSLFGTERLPKEIGQLTHLQLLDLGKCSRLKFIPPNVLSNLKSLEELYLPNDVEWEIEAQSTERINAMVSELDHLSHLTKLHICIENAEILPNAMVFERLESYRIFIGSAWIGDETSETSRILYLNTSFQSDCGYKVLFRKCETLILDEMKGVKNNLYELDSEGFQSLKHLTVKDNDEIQYIFKSMGVLDSVFPFLESINLLNVNNLERIIMDPQGIITCTKLRKIEIGSCSSLKSVFPTSVAKALMQLEQLKIKDCATVEEIVAKEEGIETTTFFVFPQLTRLTLLNLPELKSFYPGKHISKWLLLNHLSIANCDKLKIFGSNKESVEETNGLGHDVCVIQDLFFFSEKDKFPNLEHLSLEEGDAMNETCGGPSAEFCCNLKKLRLYRNPRLKNSVPNVEAPIARAGVSDFRRLNNIVPFSSTSFHYLQTLEVYGYDVLISLLTPSTTRTLVRLQEIRILHCKRMTEIVANEGSEAEAGDEIAFNNLTSLYLTYLPSLTAFHLGNRTIKFPSLDSVSVSNCPKLISLLTPSTARTLMQLQELGIHECKRMTEIVANEGSEADAGDEITFNNLEDLKLYNLPSLTAFHLGNRTIKFPSLVKVDVDNCPKLISLLTPSTARTLVQLREIGIQECKRMTEIVANEGSEVEAGDEIAFNNLTYLNLNKLPSLTAFHLGNRTIKFPSLKTVEVKNCPKLKIFCSGVLSTPKLIGFCIESEFKFKAEGDGDVDLNATIKEYWEAKLETSDQKFAEKTNASDNEEREHYANDDLERETTSEVGDTQCDGE